MKSMKETWRLNNGVQIPCLGFGTYKAAEGSTSEIIKTAIRCGYRYLDTASFYETETYVGEAVAESGIRREEFFLVSKVWKDEMGYDGTLRAFERTLENLGTDYLDLYLIHQPLNDYYGAWRAMEEMYEAGKIRAIGVCSFYPDRLADLIAFNKVAPAVNQVEANVFFQQKESQKYMESKGVVMEGWAPFAEGKNDLFHNETLRGIGEKYGKTIAQVVLRWLLQRGVVCIPKSAKRERMEENFQVFDFTLSETDMETIAALDTGKSCFFDHRDPAVVENLAGMVRNV